MARDAISSRVQRPAVGVKARSVQALPQIERLEVLIQSPVDVERLVMRIADFE